MSSEKSTIVRVENPAPLPPRAPGPVRATFSALDVLAPRVAGHLARRAWFRLPETPGADRRGKRTPPGGEPFTVSRGGLTVRGLSYGPEDRPVAHLVHGWGGWWQQLAAHVEPLLAVGYRVVVHDSPSHGDSPAGRRGPRSTTIPEMAEAFAAVSWQQGPADLVVAHSLGAMVALEARDPGGADPAYAFIAPAVDVENMFPWFQHVLGVGDRTLPHLRTSVEGYVGRPMADFSLLTAARELAGRPGEVPALLTTHSRDDADNPAQGSVDLAEAWPGADLHLTDGLGHRRILWDPESVGRVTEFAAAVRP